MDAEGKTLYISDSGNNRIVATDLQARARTLLADSLPSLSCIDCVAVRVTRCLIHLCAAPAPQGKFLFSVGSGTIGLRDGPGAEAQFNRPQGVAVDSARGLLYVAVRAYPSGQTFGFCRSPCSSRDHID